GVALGFTLSVSAIGGSDGAYRVRFDRVQGLGTGDPVLYNGLRIGTVTSVQPDVVDGRPVVVVGFDIEEELRRQVLINDGSALTVDRGMLGGAALAIETRGRGEPISDQGLEALHGVPPTTLAEAVTNFDRIVSENRDDVREAVSFLPNAVRNFSDMSSEIRNLIRTNSENIARAVQKIGDMGAAVERLATENREEVGRAVQNVGDMSGEIQSMVAENRPQVKAAIDQFPQTVENINAAAAEIRAAVSDNRARIDRTMQAFADLGPKLDTIGDDVQDITAQIRSGRGTMGRLIYDEDLHNQAQQVLTAAEQRLEEVKPVTSGFSDLRFYIGVETGYDLEVERSITSLYVRVEPKPWKFYEGGFTYRGAPADRDVVDEDPDEFNIDIDLVLGFRFFPDETAESYLLSTRVGLIEGQLGGAVAGTLWPHRLWARVMARGRHDQWDENERRFEEGDGIYVRTWLEGRVWNRFFVQVGANDVLEEAGFYAGVRFELLDMDIRNVVAARTLLP
ncbi:MAG: MlaD family protein, partial [Planctomycetota bacterium]